MAQERVEGVVKLVEKKDAEKQMEGKEKSKHKGSDEKPKLKENVSKLKEGSRDSLDFRNIKSSESLKLSNVSPAAEGNLGKRKELEENGYLLGLANNHIVDIKEQKLNGLVAVQEPNMCSKKPSSVGVAANENSEISSKPHPDVKYLSQILSIPEMEEWPDANDQEWLFSSSHLLSKKPSGGSPGMMEHSKYGQKLFG
ncbi:hypothetical protein GH714_026794 [Hevea brasiliensis]|uniref:Uncharacterized protein n=1 Tax=Hevea brasiliensis TaxID=3981 RepID=A0A6A6KD15_HEVBR|nr:hypothetical protein GH714_026794 [Hevea brasiliensis]